MAPRGCDSPRPLPKCPSTRGGRAGVPTWLDIVKRAPKLVGKTIRVRGPLDPGLNVRTLKFCGSNNGKVRCCNRTGGPVSIGGAAYVLEVEGLSCHADDSLFCCNVDAHRQEVIATGRLRVEPRQYHETIWRLTDAKVCTLE